MVRKLSVGPIGVNVYIVTGGPSVVVVDPGAEAPSILAELLSGPARPASVVVACTHGHLDHTAAAAELLSGLRAAGVAATFCAHGGDAAYFGAGAERANELVFEAIGAGAYFGELWRPVPALDLALADGDLLPGTKLRVLHTPGHTPGGACFVDEAEGFVLTGDTLFRRGVGRTDTGDADGRALAESIERKLFPLPGDWRIWPGHGEPSTIGAERGSYL